MRGAIHPLPQYLVMAWCLVKHRDNFTFTLHISENTCTRVEDKFNALEMSDNFSVVFYMYLLM